MSTTNMHTGVKRDSRLTGLQRIALALRAGLFETSGLGSFQVRILKLIFAIEFKQSERFYPGS